MDNRTYKRWTYWLEEISKQTIEGVLWFLLTGHSKMKEEKDKWRKETEHDDLQGGGFSVYLDYKEY